MVDGGDRGPYEDRGHRKVLDALVAATENPDLMRSLIADADSVAGNTQGLEGPVEVVHLLGLAQSEVGEALGRASLRAAAAPSDLPDYDAGELEDAVTAHAIAWRAALRAGWSEGGLKRLGLIGLAALAGDHLRAVLVASEGEGSPRREPSPDDDGTDSER